MKRHTLLNDTEHRAAWIAFIQRLHPTVPAQSVRLMDEIAFLGRALTLLGEQSLIESGMSFAQYRVLLHLFFAEQMHATPQMNPSQISEMQGVTRGTMSSLIRNLEEEGLVQRRLDPDDRRRFGISLTDEGRRMVTHHISDHLAMIERAFDTLSGDEQQTLVVLLGKLSQHLMGVKQAEATA